MLFRSLLQPEPADPCERHRRGACPEIYSDRGSGRLPARQRDFSDLEDDPVHGGAVMRGTRKQERCQSFTEPVPRGAEKPELAPEQGRCSSI